ncbi:hypothetical protein TNCV_4215321 [Trichonephila clavipes]|nr:hypothetical protein TNCV_4215321 [Trichonephila clavipes]
MDYDAEDRGIQILNNDQIVISEQEEFDPVDDEMDEEEDNNERSFAMREKGGNRLLPGPDFMVDAFKLPNQAPRVSGESHYRRVWRGAVLMEHNTSSVGRFWPFMVSQ